jgi:Uma2 family endonuclease
MPTQTSADPSLADLLELLGDVPTDRILLRPAPGTATEDDLEKLLRAKRLVELVEGTLVEKAMGALESALATWIIRLLGHYLDANDFGELLGPDGALRLMPGLVRIPDISFLNREKLPGGLPKSPVPELCPDLAIEVLSEGNRAGEVRRKLKDYFLAGVTLVWVVDPRKRTVVVHTAPDQGQTLTEADTLTGGSVLPGFEVHVRRVFERLPAPTPARRRKKRGV